MQIKAIDAHGHIHGSEYDKDREEVISRMKENGVAMITVGTSLEDSKKAVELAEKHENIWAAIGVHPTDTEEIFEESNFERLVKSERVVAIGECGLDYHHEKDLAKREIQKENFLKQLDFAVKYQKPLMIHCRPSFGTMDAHEDLLKILKEAKDIGKNFSGNIHFFTGTEEVANNYFELGFTVSIPGVVTFAKDVAKVVKELPLEKMLIETDCPYATPVPHRGERNEPVFVIDTARKIAELKGVSLEEVLEKTSQNTQRVFNIN